MKINKKAIKIVIFVISTIIIIGCIFYYNLPILYNNVNDLEKVKVHLLNENKDGYDGFDIENLDEMKNIYENANRTTIKKVDVMSFEALEMDYPYSIVFYYKNGDIENISLGYEYEVYTYLPTNNPSSGYIAGENQMLHELIEVLKEENKENISYRW